MEDVKNMKLVKGDASSRKFFRVKKNKKSKIVILSTTDKKKNLLDYDAVNKILIKNKIRAPRLIKQNFKKNYIEVEDFGNQTIFKIFKKCNTNRKIEIYKKIIDELVNLQKIKTRRIKNFKKKIYFVPDYSNKILKKEVDLFFDWYLKYSLNKHRKLKISKKIRVLLYKFLKSFKLKNKVFVHKDFHISNLLLKKKNICLIDNQDALFGNPVYDLCSLVDDVRYKTKNSLKNKLINYYLLKNKIKFSKKNFINDFEIHSIIRNLKIIGIFTRLSARDKKHKYLKLIPHAWKLIENRLDNKKKFYKLKMLLNKL
tara:strand:+ start:940 stop:1878 length:939 start_codon:yes stop_codon:yes gene_type:complete